MLDHIALTTEQQADIEKRILGFKKKTYIESVLPQDTKYMYVPKSDWLYICCDIEQVLPLMHLFPYVSHPQLGEPSKSIGARYWIHLKNPLLIDSWDKPVLCIAYTSAVVNVEFRLNIATEWHLLGQLLQLGRRSIGSFETYGRDRLSKYDKETNKTNYYRFRSQFNSVEYEGGFCTLTDLTGEEIILTMLERVTLNTKAA